MRKSALAVAVGTFAFAAFGMTGPASASAAGPTICNTITGVSACWQPDGDYFSVVDTAADGHHVEVAWAIPGRQGICQNFLGNGYQEICTYDFPEHQLLAFSTSVWEGNELVRSSKQVNACTSPAGGICS
jgi:hypothetical protein